MGKATTVGKILDISNWLYYYINCQIHVYYIHLWSKISESKEGVVEDLDKVGIGGGPALCIAISDVEKVWLASFALFGTLFFFLLSF